MVLVLNAPGRADGEGLGVETDLTGVAADLLARRPQAGPGVLLEGQARDPGDAGDQRLPLGVQLVSKTSTNRCSWRRRRSRSCRRGGAEPGQCLMQGGLVLLHLDQQAISAARVKLSFWQCRASAVNSTPLTPNSVISVGTAGISLGAPATSWWARMRAASLARRTRRPGAGRPARSRAADAGRRAAEPRRGGTARGPPGPGAAPARAGGGAGRPRPGARP